MLDNIEWMQVIVAFILGVLLAGVVMRYVNMARAKVGV